MLNKYTEIHTFVKQRRKLTGLTQVEFAEKADVGLRLIIESK